jgi:hypothetical protein
MWGCGVCVCVCVPSSVFLFGCATSLLKKVVSVEVWPPLLFFRLLAC